MISSRSKFLNTYQRMDHGCDLAANIGWNAIMIPTFKLIFFNVKLACKIAYCVRYSGSFVHLVIFLLCEMIHPTTTVEILASSTLITLGMMLPHFSHFRFYFLYWQLTSLDSFFRRSCYKILIFSQADEFAIMYTNAC